MLSRCQLDLLGETTGRGRMDRYHQAQEPQSSYSFFRYLEIIAGSYAGSDQPGKQIQTIVTVDHKEIVQKN